MTAAPAADTDTETPPRIRGRKSRRQGFNSLCDVGQRLPLHPNLLSVMSKSEMTWRAREDQKL